MCVHQNENTLHYSSPVQHALFTLLQKRCPTCFYLNYKNMKAPYNRLVWLVLIVNNSRYFLCPALLLLLSRVQLSSLEHHG